jgi:hypothetical protein
MGRHPKVGVQMGEILRGAPEMGELPIDESNAGWTDPDGRRPEIAHDKAAAGAEKPFAEFFRPLAKGGGVRNSGASKKGADAAVLDAQPGFLNGLILKIGGKLGMVPALTVEAPDEVAERRGGLARRGKVRNRLGERGRRPNVFHNEDVGVPVQVQRAWSTDSRLGNVGERALRPKSGQGPRFETDSMGIQRNGRIGGDMGRRVFDDDGRGDRGNPPDLVEQSAGKRFGVSRGRHARPPVSEVIEDLFVVQGSNFPKR